MPGSRIYRATGFLLALALATRFPLTVLVAVTAYALTGDRRRPFLNALYTLPRDLHLLKSTGKGFLFGIVYQQLNYHVLKMFKRNVCRQPKKVAFMTHNSKWTFEEVDEHSNRVGRYFKEVVGLKRGDVVALFAEGRPEYVSVWLGLAKVGLVTALINSNQRKSVLRHSLDAVKAKYLIYGTELTQAVKDLDGLEDYVLFSTGGGDVMEGSKNLDSELLEVSNSNLDREMEKVNFNDKLIYIYTSGTTGLPKAAVITHGRFLVMGLGFGCSGNTSSRDTVYTPLPLYHSAGGILGVSQALLMGATVFIRPKFSASNFWKDCIQYNCTMAQYIGEICRFLLSRPIHPDEKKHKLRAMYGNGLRPQIWTQFVDRFRIPWIIEFYGATEGNANLINTWNQVGAVGYLPWFVRTIYPLRLVRVKQNTNEPIRGVDGLCIQAEIGEPGLLVSKIRKQFGSSFHGYSDAEATKKKILRNVFERDDSAFNSGDVLVTDELGYFYFRDRTGDTFRWKGENVSTAEVEAVVSNIIGLKDSIAYGVEIPHNEGKAGMVAIVDEEKVVDLKVLLEGIKKSLSSYARPIFIRVLEKTPLTATFKLQKVDLQNEGYDLDRVKDPLYFLDSAKGEYIPFTKELANQLECGEARV